ncbi:MAG: CopD family protein [Bacteroidota bacterium]
MNPFYIKALHIIFVVSWFAGLFYLVRLFIYQREAQDRPDNERQVLVAQFRLMESRLWTIITIPSMVGTVLTGLYLGHAFQMFGNTWMWVKLGMVGALFIYHHLCGTIRRQFAAGEYRYNSTQLRVWNEVATLLLISIVFLVVLKQTISMFWGILGLMVIAGFMMIAIRLYKRLREKKNPSSIRSSSV